MKKENQRVAQTKQLLREALFRLLQDENLNKITITKLCHEAGVNRDRLAAGIRIRFEHL